MCLVEVGTRDPQSGKITMQSKLAPACNHVMTAGVVLVTNSEKVAHARAMVEEGLLLRHPIDCPICDKAGECKLQDYHFKYGQGERRADIRPFTSRRRDLGDVTLFVDRCVMCSRCVRFTAEISGSNELMVTGRERRTKRSTSFPAIPCTTSSPATWSISARSGAWATKTFCIGNGCGSCGNIAGICTGCATGCATWIEENQDRIYRIKPRENPLVNQWWICNDGRYDYPHVHNPERLTRPRRRDGESWMELDWTGLAGELQGRLQQAGRLAVIVSPFLTVEEAYLLCKFVRGIDSQASLVLGPVPVVGEDERFRNGFTIPPRNARTAAAWRRWSLILPSERRRLMNGCRAWIAATCRAYGCRADTRANGSTRPPLGDLRG